MSCRGDVRTILPLIQPSKQPSTLSTDRSQATARSLLAAYGHGAGCCHPAPCQAITVPGGFRFYQEPVLGMLAHGSEGGSAPPACSSSMEMPSGVRMKAMWPSRGGRLIVTPRAMKALQVS
jgi:hypothetical protein